MNNLSKRIIALTVAAIVVILIATQINSQKELGSADNGVNAFIATSSTITVGPGVATVFASSTTCTSRVITTVAQPIMLSFSTDIAPSGSVGHLQGASTTVAYDSGIYGCGIWKAASYVASTSITKSEFR